MLFPWLRQLLLKKCRTAASRSGLSGRTRLRVEPLEARWCPSSFAPQVTLNPLNTTVDAGHMVTLSAAATGMPMLQVQWEVSTDGGKHFQMIAGANQDTYTWMASAGQNGFDYEAVFTNAFGQATTRAAKLTVDFAPIITRNPHSQAVAVGSQVTLTAAARSDPTATVQWQVSTDGGKTYSNIAGATSTTLTFTAPTTAGVERFRAVFTNALGRATSQAAVVHVDVPPTVTTNPTSQTIAHGQRVTFSAAASGTPAPHVQWQVSTDGGQTFHNIQGATRSDYTFIARMHQNGYAYRAVFTDPVGKVVTTDAVLTVT